MTERLARWRLVLGGAEADGTGVELRGDALAMDRALDALYDPDRHGGLGASSPGVARWLGDIREYFPTSVVQVMQRDAMDRLGLHQLMLEPEVLAEVEPDVHLVSTLVSLNRVIPEHTRDTARRVVRAVVEQVERRLAQRTRQAVSGALDRAARTSRPRRPADVDWPATIRANLRNYDAEVGTVVPERLVGHARRRRAIERDVILCVDQSGSMASSVVYSSIFAAVLASIRTLRTQLILFDTAVVDMTERLADPVDVLFGAQLGGGTDIAQALQACQGLVRRPADTVLVLISDLYEGGDPVQMMRIAKELIDAEVQVVVLLALSDDGAPSFDHDHAAFFASLGAPAFACTPDQFPDLIAAAIERRDVAAWAADAGIGA
ncbi:MAG TPA: VWA domain-containing protein [Solirubrobacteraceae bacterium]